jgi:hypothetical protein
MYMYVQILLYLHTSAAINVAFRGHERDSEDRAMAVLPPYLMWAGLCHIIIIVVEKVRLQIHIKQKNRETLLEASKNFNVWKSFFEIY